MAVKPRPPPYSLTLEDLNIVLQLALRSRPRHDEALISFLRVVVDQDRRDADLMLEAQQHPNWVRSEYGHFIRSIGQAIKANPSSWRC